MVLSYFWEEDFAAGPYVEAAAVPLTHSVSFEPWETELDQELLSPVTSFTAGSVVGDFLQENSRALSPEKGKIRVRSHMCSHAEIHMHVFVAAL